MGNSASDIASRVASQSSENLAKTLKSDLEVLEDLSILSKPSKLMARSDLEAYEVPGSSKAKGKLEDVGTLQEQKMTCSLSNKDCFKEKYSDSRKELVNQIVTQRGEDPSSKEITLRLKAMCRIYEAILRVDERRNRKSKEEKKKEESKKGGLPSTAKVAMRFGLNSLLQLIKVVGNTNPEIFEYIIKEATDILSELEPLSLETEDLAVSKSLDTIAEFFHSVLKGGHPNISDSLKLASLSPLFGLAVTTGSLPSALSIAECLMLIPKSENIRPAMESIYPMLKSFANLSMKTPQPRISWLTDRKGESMTISEDRLSCEVTSSNWGVALSEQEFESGVHYFEMEVNKLSSVFLIFGVATTDYNKLENWSDDSQLSFSYQARHEIWRCTNSIYTWEAWQVNDKIGLVLDMDKKEVTFFKNGKKEPRGSHGPLPDKVRLFCAIKENCKITMINNPEVPEEAFEIGVPFAAPEGEEVQEEDISNHFKEEIPSEDYFKLSASDIAYFIIKKLSDINEPMLDRIESHEKSGNVKEKVGLALSVQNMTIDLLNRIIETTFGVLKESNFDLMEEDKAKKTLVRTIRVLKSHLLAVPLLPNINIDSNLRVRSMEILKQVLQEMPSEICEEATKTMSMCFEAFYVKPFEKLTYLLESLKNMKNGVQISEIFKQLENRIFLEMAQPTKLYPALQITTHEQVETIKEYFQVLLELAAEQSSKIIEDESQELGIIKLLETSQLVLLSQAAKQDFKGNWQDLLVDYCSNAFKKAETLLRKINEKFGQEVSDEASARIQKTIAVNLFESLLYSLMLSKLGLEFLSEVLPTLQNLLSLASRFTTKPPILTLGNGIVNEVYESPHNYPDNADMSHLVQVPGAVKYILHFDPQCKTESGCDYLELWSDQNKTNQVRKFEGDNWPKEPLEVNNPVLYFTFRSDGSVNYWGWKIDIEAIVEGSYWAKQWPETSREALGMVLAFFSKKLIAGDFEMLQEEEEAAKLLQNPLLIYGIHDKALGLISEYPPLNPHLVSISTTSGIVDKMKQTLLVRQYSQDVSNRIVKSESLAITLADYVEEYGDWGEPKYSENPFLQELIEGSERVKKGWTELKKKSGVFGPSANIGGSELDQAERAIFGVYCAFFEITDTVSKLMDSPGDIGKTFKFIVKQSSLIRGWAQKQKQKLMDSGNPDINYTKIADDVVKKCSLLLNSEYKLALNELGTVKVMKNLLSSVSKVQSKGSASLKVGSRWKSVKEAVKTMSKLRGLLNISSKETESDNEDIKEFMKVSELVTGFLETQCPVEKLVELIEHRRTRAIARTIGYLSISNLINVSTKQETALIRTFADTLVTKEGKKHYWEGLEAVDPKLLTCVQKAFFGVYSLLQKDVVRSVSRPFTMSSFYHYLTVLDAMSSPLKSVDSHMILEMQFPSTLRILLSWAKGYLVSEVIEKPFQKEKCITGFCLLPEQEIPEDAEKIKLQPSEENGLCLQVLRGGKELPVSEFTVSSEVLPEYEDGVGAFNFNGQEVYIMLKRAKEEPGVSYLTGLSEELVPAYTSYNELIGDEPENMKEERMKLRQRLAKSSWAVVKLLMYSIVGTMAEVNEAKQILVQEVFLKVITQETQWNEALQKTDNRPLELDEISSGKNWLEKTQGSQEFKKNPMEEWLRRFNSQTENMEMDVLKDIIKDYVEKADPAMKGVLAERDVANLDQSTIGTLSQYEENKNSKGEYDFFRYLNVLRDLIGDFPLEVQEYVLNSNLWKEIPTDYYEACKDYDFTDIQRFLNNVAQKFKPNEGESFKLYLDLFLASEEPGVVPSEKVPENTPPEFLNSNKNLDLYLCLWAVRGDSEKYSVFTSELSDVFEMFDSWPKSCQEVNSEKQAPTDYICSLLWSVLGSMGSSCLPKVLAREEHLQNLIKICVFSRSERLTTLSLRVLTYSISKQHSVQTFQKIWEELLPSFAKSDQVDFVSFLIKRIGKGLFWFGEENKSKFWIRWGYESANLLLALTSDERWRTEVVENLIEGLKDAKNYLEKGMPLTAIHLGIVGFLKFICPESSKEVAFPLELSPAMFQDSQFAKGIIKKVEGEEVELYSVVEDNLAKEPISKMRAQESYVSYSLLDSVTEEERDSLAESIVGFWKALQTPSAIKTHPSKVGFYKAIYGSLDLYCLGTLSEMVKKFECINEAKALELAPHLVKTKQFEDSVVKSSYRKVLNAIASKIGFKESTAEESKTMTEEEARKKLSEMNENDQIAATELLSLEIPIQKIVKCFELGLKSTDEVLNYQEPETGAKSAQLYSLSLFENRDFDIVDNQGNSEIYQNTLAQLVINDKTGSHSYKSISNVISSEIFRGRNQAIPEITLLASLAWKNVEAECCYGLILGDLTVSLKEEEGTTYYCVKEKVVSQFRKTDQLNLRVHAKSDGSVTVVNESNGIKEETQCCGVFDGLRVGSVGVFLEKGEEAGLLGLEIYEGIHKGAASKKYQRAGEQGLGNRYLRIKTKPANLKKQRLELLGVNEEGTKRLMEQESFSQSIAQAIQGALADPPSIELNDQYITELKLFEALPLPSDYEPVKLYYEKELIESDIKNRNILAMKKEVGTSVALLKVAVVESDEGMNEIGNLTADTEKDSSNIVYVKTGDISEKNKPIRDIIFVKTHSVNAVELPPGYRVLMNKEGKAINLAPKDEKTFCVFAAVLDKKMVGCCEISPLSGFSHDSVNMGMVDDFKQQAKQEKKDDNKYEEFGLLELLNWHVEYEKSHKEAEAVAMMNSLLEKYPGLMGKLSEEGLLGSLLNLLGSKISGIADHLVKNLSEDKNLRFNSVVDSLDILLKYYITKGGSQLKGYTVESSHPYENNLDVDQTITVPGARSLRIEFDPQCHTEGGCDILRFYENSGRNGELRALSGEGTSNWGTPLEVEGDTCYMYFHSDGSVVYWGYKFDVVPVGTGSKPESDPEGALLLLEKLSELPELEGVEFLQSSQCLQTLLVLCLSSQSIDHKVRIIKILMGLIRGQKNLGVENILEVFTKELEPLYRASQTKNSPHPLLHILIQFSIYITKNYKKAVPYEWFEKISNLITDMQALAFKDERLRPFLFNVFSEQSKVSIAKVVESQHPYSRQLTKELVEFAGMDSLEVQLDEESCVEQEDSAYFAYDEEGKQQILMKAGSASSNAKWASEPRGPDIAFEDSNLSVTRTNSNDWGCAVWDTSYSSGKIKITFHVKNDGDSSYWYLGVMNAKENHDLSKYMGTDSPHEVWSWKRSGEFHRKGFQDDGVGFSSGDTIAMLIDCDNRELTFFKESQEVYKFTNIAEQVIPGICFGGSNQVMTVKSVEVLSGAGNDIFSSRKLRVTGDKVYIWAPVNVGVTRSYLWTSEFHTCSKSQGCLLLTKTQEGDSMHEIAQDLRVGRNYIEIEVKSSNPVKLGLALKSKLKDVESEGCLFYSSDGNVCLPDGEVVCLEAYGKGDIIGIYSDVLKQETWFFKNEKGVKFGFNLSPEDEPVYFTAFLSKEGDSLRINENCTWPEELQMLNPREEPTEKWGYRFKALPAYDRQKIDQVDSILSYLSAEDKEQWEAYYNKFSQLIVNGVAEQLVMYLDEFSASKGINILELDPNEIKPTPNELIYYPDLEKVPKEDLQSLFKILVSFNKETQSFLNFFNLHIDSLEKLDKFQKAFIGCRSFIFFKIKNEPFKAILDKTNTDVKPEITIDRPKASRHRQRKDVDVQGQFSIFGQIYRNMIQSSNRDLRNSERIFKVNYRGEGSVDAGGPYNEVMSNICDELQSSFLRLLVPTQNNQHNMGEHRESWIVNPAATSPGDMDLFLFLGKLMGVAIRTQNNLNLSLPPLFWKHLVMDSVSVRDLRATDVCTVQILEILQNLEANGVTPSSFSSVYDEHFTYKDSSGREVELFPGGNLEPVTFENAPEYAQMVIKHRLSEIPEAYKQLRKGMSAVIPIDYLNLFSWRQVETLVCGAPDIDVEILKSNTDYEGYSENEEPIKLFWEVLTEMTPRERSLFLKFVWGRSRLPSGRDWRHMKITKYNPPGLVNNYMPISHTCFFTIDLPPYTTKDAMRQKLLYAITHCTAIDLDGAAGQGWEEDE